MEELVRLVATKTGIGEDKARTAVELVLNFIKERLPNPIASQIDTMVGRGGPGSDPAKGLGDLLGKK